MRRTLVLALAALPLASCAQQTAQVASTPQVAASAEPAPAPAALADLVAGVNIPYESFTLANGLTVLVHTDRKAPIAGLAPSDSRSARATSPRGGVSESPPLGEVAAAPAADGGGLSR